MLIATSCGYTSLINSFVESIMQKEKPSFLTPKSSKGILSSMISLYAIFEQQKLWVPLINKARSKMASRDLCFRDALHDNLKEYIGSVSVDDFDRFIGDKSMELSKRLETYIAALKRLKNRD